MTDKETFDTPRHGLRKVIHSVTDPMAGFLTRIGVTPRLLAAASIICNILAAMVILYAGVLALRNPVSLRFDLIIWSGAIALLGALLGLLDAPVSRHFTGETSGKSLHDTLPGRYSALLLPLALTFFLLVAGYTIGAVITLISLIGCFAANNVTAAPHDSAPAQRSERVALFAAGCLVCGIVGTVRPNSPHTAISAIVIATTIVAVLAIIAAISARRK